ncbi:RTA1 like protein-domain-containing protein [Pisolithus croceorrhizus]|nr:RTA1 like protein-domain-containing protein [Pisolithus croceorrhizus]KAI6135818.1 RTA1 like protein-domain-containing protein [Pisolithus croceorrhizus]KAI6169563.1 RTA1 like protein-domain-containing protein [Pisolithus thermaeus]
MVLPTLRWFVPLFSLLALFGTVGAAQNSNGETIVQVVYNYNPSQVLAAVAGSLYLLCSACLFARTFSHRAWWGLCLPIGSIAMAIGFFIRIALPKNPNSLIIFILQSLLILLSPAAFLAFNYVLYGRFVSNCVSPSYSWVPPRKVAKWFVSSDLTTFLIQMAGGGIQTSKSISTDKLGANIMLAGLALQAVSFGLFILLFLHVCWRIRADRISPLREPWGPIVPAMLFSSAMFMVRCVYRTVELAQGSGGYLMTHELWFYILDTLPLFIGISVYVPFWPSKYLVTRTDLPTSKI